MSTQSQLKPLFVCRTLKPQSPTSQAAKGISRLRRMAIHNLFALATLGFLLECNITSAASYTVNLPNAGYFYFLVNQLNASPDNRADHVFPDGTLPDATELLTYDCSSQSFKAYLYDSSVGISPNNWYDLYYVPIPPLNLPLLTPGTGFLLLPSAPIIPLTFSGTLPSPGPITLPCGLDTYSLVGRPDYVVGNSAYQDILGSPVSNTHVEKWNVSTQTFEEYIYTACGIWIPSAPVFAPSESALIYVPSTSLTGLQIFIEGRTVTALGHTMDYTLRVINFGPGSSTGGLLTLTGVPGASYATLYPPTGATSISGPPQGFSISVPALSCGGAAAFNFQVSDDALTVGNTYTMMASFGSATATLTVNVVDSIDPNDKSGPAGTGPNHYLTGSLNLGYTIAFENLSTATAPAQRVVVTDQLDPSRVSLGSFSLGSISFGDQVVTPPPGVDTYSTTVPYDVDGNNINVKIDATIDLFFGTPGKVTWTFQTLDPNTGLPPSNPLIGFLPPNITPPEGQGIVSFTVDPLPGLVSGSQITNAAVIVFDSNPAIATGVWTNTIIKFSMTYAGGQATITWSDWILEEAGSLSGPWSNAPVQVSPWTFTPVLTQKFYRLMAP